MSKEQDAQFIRIFIVIIVILSVFGIVAAIMGRHFAKAEKKDVYVSDTLEKRIAPVGEDNTDPNAHLYAAIPVGAAPKAATAEPEKALTGEALGKHTFDTVCMACHATGVAGAPKFGDKDAWAPRIKKGIDTLHQHALQGFQGSSGVMPPKGGNPALPDDAVKAAVDYMVANSGGPAMPAAATPAKPAAPESSSAAPAPAPAAAAPAAPAPEAAAAAASGSEASTDTAGTGKHIYSTVCFACHATGVAGAPKFGDKDAWAPRIAQGKDTLYKHALNGFLGEGGGMMPPKGGRTDLSDDQVKAAVDYMVSAAQ